ncbi:MAG: hypothetical protein ACJ761_10225 [Chloroflexota bacterium]
MRSARSARSLFLALGAVFALGGNALASTPGTDVRLTHDEPGSNPYVSNYTAVTGNAYTDATLTECSNSSGRQNEPAVEVDPRNHRVLVGSSNDYCGVYNDGADDDGAPLAVGPIWLGYYRSEDYGHHFTSSLVPGYPTDTSPYASRARIRTASSGDPVLAWDGDGRLFAGAEASEDPAGTKKTFGDVWVATYENPSGTSGATINDGKEFKRSVVVAKGTSAPNLLGVFRDKTAIEADRTNTACRGNVYFANSRFTGLTGHSNIYFYRSTNHGATFSNGTLLTTSANTNVQDPDVSVTGNGHVYVTWDVTLHKGNKTFDAIMYAKSTNCGRTFAPEKVLRTVESYLVQDVADPQEAPASPADDSSEDEAAPDSLKGDCGDASEACTAGFTFFREGTSTRSTADQYDTAHEYVYLTYHASIPGTEVATGNTFGTVRSGLGSQAGAYFVRLNGATGISTAPALIDPTDHQEGQGHQIWPDISADGGVLHVLWYDSRADECYAPTRPIGNCADRSVTVSLDTYGAKSTDRGATFTSITRLTDVSHAPNYEQFVGRTVPFHGDYIWVTSKGNFAYGTWSDQRNAVAGEDQREGDDEDGDDGADVHQCRTESAPDVFTGDTCPRAGGIDQNIYGDFVP